MTKSPEGHLFSSCKVGAVHLQSAVSRGGLGCLETYREQGDSQVRSRSVTCLSDSSSQKGDRGTFHFFIFVSPWGVHGLLATTPEIRKAKLSGSAGARRSRSPRKGRGCAKSQHLLVEKPDLLSCSLGLLDSRAFFKEQPTLNRSLTMKTSEGLFFLLMFIFENLENTELK